MQSKGHDAVARTGMPCRHFNFDTTKPTCTHTTNPYSTTVYTALPPPAQVLQVASLEKSFMPVSAVKLAGIAEPNSWHESPTYVQALPNCLTCQVLMQTPSVAYNVWRHPWCQRQPPTTREL
jgi:hypothetical protein